ncbi:FecR family protein [Desulfovibrio mangrovi]|uniref:FecR family protein n=1 Tax=Desulfovibrio mangrovi TaxID=2976983 RepID=UPI0022484258|nr:FecR family protein [Desulfovibrio mangrovi]UZP68146.1 FecR family protein [Desulfovibrio mangrovi]
MRDLRSHGFPGSLRFALPVLILLVPVLVWLQVAQAEYVLPLSGKARVTYVEGSARLVAESGDVLLAQGMELVSPCTVDTGDSRLELLMPDGSVLRFAAATRFSFTKAVVDTQNRKIEVDVAVGDAWANVKDFLGEGSSFEIAAPTAVAGVAGTTYRVRVSQARETSVFVYDGRVRVRQRWAPQGSGELSVSGEPVRVQGPERIEGPVRVEQALWERMVSMGMQFDISAAGTFSEPIRFDAQLMEQDEWVRWNLERDRFDSAR